MTVLVNGRLVDYDSWDYLCKKTNFHWVARNSRGVTLDSSPTNTSLEDLVNTCLTAMGNTHRQILKIAPGNADWNIDDPIIYAGFNHIKILGKIFLENASNCNMLENANPGTNDIETIIEGGMLDGNKANQTGPGHNVYHRNASQPASGRYGNIYFRCISLVDAFDDGLHVDCDGSSGTIAWIEEVFQRFCYDYGINLQHVNDAWMSDSLFYGGAAAGSGMFHESGPIQMNGIYFEQKVTMESCVAILADTLWIDVGENVDGLDMLGSRYCDFTNLNIRVVGSSAFVGNSAIVLRSNGGVHAIENSFDVVKAGRFGLAGTNRWNFIIEEQANSDLNAYNNIYPDDYVTAVADLQGTRQKLASKGKSAMPLGGSAHGAWGVDVDAGGEEAYAVFDLTDEIHEIVFIEIPAYAVVPAGQEMEMVLNVDGGAENEPSNTHTLTVANLDSLTTNFAALDNILFRVNSRDYAAIRALTAGDRVRISAEHEVGAGGDTTTDAHFGPIKIRYV